MSVTIEFGDERNGQPIAQIATNRGWADVTGWADELENETYPELLGFIDHGECQELAALIENIDSVLAHEPPDDPAIRRTLKGLRATVKQHESEEYVIIGDGFESGYDNDDEAESE